MSTTNKPRTRGACWVLALALALSAPIGAAELEPTVILVSIDGFRWDFRDRASTPTLDKLVRRGARAKRLIPSFPTKTFPNHYTLVTGLYPAKHGLVANNMYDPVFDATYGLSKRDEVANARWYDGEPIWVTAERQGQRTAPLFWPGAEAAIGGIRPTYWEKYDGSVSNEARVEKVLAWLDRPAEQRPTFITLYFSTVDDAAHERGPEPSRRLRGAVRAVDRALGKLVRGLEKRDLENEVDLIVVADHGHSSTSRDRLILIDQLIDIDTANVVDWNPVLALWPSNQDKEEIYQALAGAHPHLKVYRRDELPPELHFEGHRRIAPIVGIADDGWSIASRKMLDRCGNCFDGGTHGYDPRLESMGALFVASGPSFRRGAQVPAFENIHIYELICRILGLEPAPNDGDATATAAIMSPSFGLASRSSKETRARR